MPNNKHPSFCAWCPDRTGGKFGCENAVYGKHDHNGTIKGCKIKKVPFNHFGVTKWRIFQNGHLVIID